MDEQPRHLGQQQDRHAAGERERRPAPPQHEAGERQQEQRRDGDGAAPAEHLGGKSVVVVVRDHELVAVMPECAQPLGRPRVVRDRLVDDRLQPEKRKPRGDDRGGEQRHRPSPLVDPERRVHRQRQQQEERVRRVRERESAEDRRYRQPPVGEEECDRGREQQLPRGRAWESHRRPGTAMTRPEAEDRHRQCQQ